MAGFGYDSPASGLGGDNDGDDHAAEALWRLEGSHGTWKLPAWSKSPQQLQDEAKAMNHAGFAIAFANAGKHSNPPVVPSHLRGI